MKPYIINLTFFRFPKLTDDNIHSIKQTCTVWNGGWKQRDTWNCGIFSCLAFWKWAQSGELDKIIAGLSGENDIVDFSEGILENGRKTIFSCVIVSNLSNLNDLL